MTKKHVFLCYEDRLHGTCLKRRYDVSFLKDKIRLKLYTSFVFFVCKSCIFSSPFPTSPQPQLRYMSPPQINFKKCTPFNVSFLYSIADFHIIACNFCKKYYAPQTSDERMIFRHWITIQSIRTQRFALSVANITPQVEDKNWQFRANFRLPQGRPYILVWGALN